MRLIGDVHGKYDQYKRILKLNVPTIQVGDMGVGFRRRHNYHKNEFYPNPPHKHMIDGNHRFIRGNHDNPEACRNHSQWITDGTIEDGVMFIGGGLSIDKDRRLEGYDWWADEELDYKTLWDLQTVYEKTKPKVMVTHDCPELVAEILWTQQYGSWEKLRYPSRTRQCFSNMLAVHQPTIWIFGHWHTSWEEVVDGCKFICLNELEWKDIDI